jgi:phosphoribosylanthranilate isomerase
MWNRTLLETLPIESADGVKLVAVTVDADDEELDDIVSMVRPDILQLHGNESPERVLQVKALFGLPVMKAFSVKEAGDLDRVDAYIGVADRFLFDAKAPAGSAIAGRQRHFL